MNLSSHNFTNKFFKPLTVPAIGLFLRLIIGLFGLMLFSVLDSYISLFIGIVSLIDFINSLFIYYAVKQSIRNPEISFNYGGGKYESIAIIWSFFALAHIIVRTIFTYDEFLSIEVTDFPIYLYLFISSIAFYILYKLQYESARHNNLALIISESHILGSKYFFESIPFISLVIIDSINYFTDNFIFQAHFISLGLFLLFAFGRIVYNLKNAFLQLMDKPLPETMQYEILAIITENIDKFCQFKAFHTRSSGKDIFIEIDIIMPWDFTVEEVFRVEAIIIKKIAEKFPNSLPRVYVFPCQKDCIYEDKINCPIKKRIIESTKND